MDEQPMPESLATRCGSMESSKQASTMAADIESCPQPAQSVESEPSYSFLEYPKAFFGALGCSNFGFIYDIKLDTL